MSSFLNAYNASILAIPAYWVLSMLPHGLAIRAATEGQLKRWDNRNPRSSDLKAKLKQRLPAEAFARYERLEACHANGMEVLYLLCFVRCGLIRTDLSTIRYDSRPWEHGRSREAWGGWAEWFCCSFPLEPGTIHRCVYEPSDARPNDDSHWAVVCGCRIVSQSDCQVCESAWWRRCLNLRMPGCSFRYWN
jgi:hypothetical protein